MQMWLLHSRQRTTSISKWLVTFLFLEIGMQNKNNYNLSDIKQTYHEKIKRYWYRWVRNHPSKTSTAHCHVVLNYCLPFHAKSIMLLEQSLQNIINRTHYMYLQTNQIKIKPNDWSHSIDNNTRIVHLQYCPLLDETSS